MTSHVMRLAYVVCRDMCTGLTSTNIAQFAVTGVKILMSSVKIEGGVCTSSEYLQKGFQGLRLVGHMITILYMFEQHLLLFTDNL